MIVGAGVGTPVGPAVGASVGRAVGDTVGEVVGETVGDVVGVSVGDAVGAAVHPVLVEQTHTALRASGPMHVGFQPLHSDGLALLQEASGHPVQKLPEYAPGHCVGHAAPGFTHNRARCDGSAQEPPGLKAPSCPWQSEVTSVGTTYRPLGLVLVLGSPMMIVGLINSKYVAPREPEYAALHAASIASSWSPSVWLVTVTDPEPLALQFSSQVA